MRSLAKSREKEGGKERYYSWLKGLVNRRSDDSKEAIFSILWERDFDAKTLGNDVDRGLDGIALREVYYREYREATSIPDRPCSILEMLIGLSERMSWFSGHETETCFWEMINNLGLSSRNTARKNNHILDVFLERQYSSNGRGGLFPLRKPTEDLRHVEIWFQMHMYINEGETNRC